MIYLQIGAMALVLGVIILLHLHCSQLSSTWAQSTVFPKSFLLMCLHHPPCHHSTSSSIHIMLLHMNFSQLSGTWAGSDGGKGQERNSPEAETETSVIFAKFVSERIYMFAETQV